MLTGQLKSFAGGADKALLDEFGEVREGPVAPPSEEELSNGYAAPGDEALLPFGISYFANWKVYGDGMSKHAREQVAALAGTGLPIGLRSIGSEFLLTEELHKDVLDVGYLENVSFTHTLFSIKHLVLGNPDATRRIICPAASSLPPEVIERVFKTTVIYTSWERDRVHKEYVSLLNMVGRVWVPCEANRTAFVSSGVNPDIVAVIPYPFDPGSRICAIAAPRGKEDVPSGKRFYHIGKWEPRKNQHQILGAFLTSFSPKDKASLLIKTSPYRGGWPNYPSPEDSMKTWLEDEQVKAKGWSEESARRLVRIIDKKLSEEDMLAIHEKNNIYVNASCGEAWDIPAFEAKLAGNSMLFVAFGGPEDYADVTDIAIEHSMGPVNPGYQWEKDAQWAQTTVKDIGDAMLRATPKSRRVMDSRLVKKYGRAAVGNMMHYSILSLAEELGCEELLKSSGGFG